MHAQDKKKRGKIRIEQIKEGDAIVDRTEKIS